MSPTLPALEHATLCVQHAKHRATLRNSEESAQERPETAPPRPTPRTPHTRIPHPDLTETPAHPSRAHTSIAARSERSAVRPK